MFVRLNVVFVEYTHVSLPNARRSTGVRFQQHFHPERQDSLRGSATQHEEMCACNERDLQSDLSKGISVRRVYEHFLLIIVYRNILGSEHTVSKYIKCRSRPVRFRDHVTARASVVERVRYNDTR